MAKRILAVLIVAALTAVISIGALAAPGDLLWTLSADYISELINDGGTEDGNMMPAGSAVLSKDGNGLKLSMRSDDWNSIDVVSRGVLTDGVVYTIIVKFTSEVEQTFGLGQTDNPWADHIGVDGKEASATGTDVTITLKSDKIGTQGVRAKTTGTTDNYTIASVQVYEGDPPSGGGGGGGGGNPKTGDNFVIFGVLGVLGLAVCGAFVFYRKAKAE